MNILPDHWRERRSHYISPETREPAPERRRVWQRVGPGQVLLYALVLAIAVYGAWRFQNLGDDLQHQSRITCENQRVGIEATRKLRVVLGNAKPLLVQVTPDGPKVATAIDDYLSITNSYHPRKNCARS